MQRHFHWPYVLPTGEMINPTHPESHFCWSGQHGQAFIVLQKLNEPRTRPTRVVLSYGLPDNLNIGDTATILHDQTRAYLGDYRVVGLRLPTGHLLGEIPDRKISCAVFK